MKIPSFDFSDKVIVISGGASGIGRACAIGFLNAGAHVVVIDRSSQLMINEVTNEARLRLSLVRADVSDVSSVERAVRLIHQEHGQIDALINSAGLSPGRWVSLVDTSVHEWDEILNIDAKGKWLLMKHIWPYLTRPGGSVVNIVADAGLRADPGTGALSVAKHAVMGLTRTAAIEWEEDGLRVNAICPGVVQTPLRHEDGNEREALMKSAPYGRIITAEEVAIAALYLCSDVAAYINGAELVIDGGSTAGMRASTNTSYR